MRNSMILELAFSGIDYDKNIKITENKEFIENNDKVHEICENLCRDMTKEEKYKIMWDLDLALGGIGSAYVDESFKSGFKLGLIIGAQNFLD